MMNDEMSKLLEQQAEARAAELVRVLEDVRGGYGDRRDY
jgi:hypothetical protein